MNPFELPGPQFLLVYGGIGVVVALALRWMRRQQESAYTAPHRLEDPYLFAMLRGGEDEAVRVALMSMLDRKLLVTDAGEQIGRGPGVTPDQVQRDIEKALLTLGQPHAVHAILAAMRHHPVLAEYKEKLLRMGLIPDGAVNSGRVKLWLMGFGFLLTVAVIKIGIGISRDRPVAFLVLAAIVFAIVTAAVCFPRRTAGGDELVRNMKELFASLRNRAEMLRPGGETSELAWLGAVFGLAAVPALLFPFQRVLLPKNRGDQTWSASCGSSCGSSSGSSCGGGGCGGGCGGCGGG